MAEHGLAAGGTVNDPIARTLASRQGNSKRPCLMSAQRIDHGREPVHGNQHAVAASATEHRMPLEPAVGEGRDTNRAQARAFVQQLQVFDACRGLLLTAAMVAHEQAAVPVETKRCSALVAGCHDRIIGKERRDR